MWNFGDIIDAVARAVSPDAPAFMHGERAVSWNDAKRRMEGLAGALRRGGARPGDKVAFYLRNSIEYGELAGACFLGGFVHVNVNYRYKAEEVAYILDNADAVVLVHDVEFRDFVSQIRGRLPQLKLVIEVGASPEAAASSEPYEALAESGLVAADREARTPEAQVFVYTGGTTGMPKGVIYRQADLGPYLLASSGLFGTNPPQSIEEIAAMIRVKGASGVRYLPACPQMHGTGFFVTMWTMLTGGCVVTADSQSLDPHALWRTVERHRVTHIAIVGDPFARPLLRALDEDPGAYDMPSLVGIGSSGAMWSLEVKQGLLKHLPQVSLIDVFASSETTSMGISVSAGSDAAQTATFTPSANVILIDEDDRPLAPGAGLPGRLAISGMQPVGYYKDPEKTAKTFKIIDGVRYSVPGDYALIGSDGALTLLGRGSHCINTAGEKVFPEEVEEALKSHADVEDALVLGLPDETWGQSVTGVVRLTPGARLDEAALRQHVRERLAGYKTPKRIFVAVTDLRAANGKADYQTAAAVLRKQLSEV